MRMGSACPESASTPVGMSMASRNWPGTSGSARSISATWPRNGGVLPMPSSPSTTVAAPRISRANGLASPDHTRQRTPAARAASTKGSADRARDAQQTTAAPPRASARAMMSASPPLSPGPTSVAITRPRNGPTRRRTATASAIPARRIKSISGAVADSSRRMPATSTTRSKAAPGALTTARGRVTGR